MSFPLAAGDIVSTLTTLLWPFLRIGAMLTAAPVFGARNVPIPARAMLALMLALLVMPLLPPLPEIDPLSASGLLIALQQIGVGLVMGFILQMVFSVLAQAGEAMALSMGLGFASINDPQNGLSVPVVSQYYVIAATLIFLMLDGHLVVISILVDSFVRLPIGVEGLSGESLWQVVVWGASMYAHALFVALPVITAMLLVNLALGVVTRAAPQLNIFAVGFPAMLLIGLLAMMFSMPALQVHVERILEDAFNLIRAVGGG